jgi:hypothetical protein
MPTQYQPGIPTGSVPLDQDYKNLQNNFGQLDTTFGVDHVKYSVSQNNGYHTSVHMVDTPTVPPNTLPNYPAVTRPPAVVGTGQIFTALTNDGLNTDETFYLLSGANRLYQLNRNISPKNTPNGFGYIVGGMIMQWGIASIPSGFTKKTVAVTFALVTNNITFPNALYNIQLTLVGSNPSSNSSNNTLSIGGAPGDVSPTGFNAVFNGSDSTDYPFFHYVVIGN